MALIKRKKIDHVELSDNWIALPSKSHLNRIYYYNKVTKQSTWENPIKNCQKDKNFLKNPQIGQSRGSSRKRKSTGEIETNESSDTRENKLSGTSLNREPLKRDKIKAIRRTEPTKIGSSIVNMKINPDEKWNLRSTDEKRSSVRETEKQTVVDSERKKPKNIKHEEKQKISAQCRLLEKRKQFEVAAKKTLSLMGREQASNLLMEKEKDKKVKVTYNSGRKYTDYSNTFQSCLMPDKSRIRDRDKMRKHLIESKEKKIDLNIDNNTNFKIGDKSPTSDEGMDWEPSEQEIMIEHINTMRRNLGNIEELSNDITMCPYSDMGTERNENTVILVFDTNVFISCLPFIKEIRDTCIPGIGLPLIFIPWRVLQELDHLKKSDIKPLQVSAIRAIRYLNENFSSRHPRINGQSYEEFNSMTTSGSCPDDEILEMCLYLKQKNGSKILILITNDKNLESKAIVSGIEAFSKDGFLKKKLDNSNQKVSGLNINSKSMNIRLKSDTKYCLMKVALKKCLEQLLEAEFLNAFNNDWKKVVKKKPPWMLMDLFECLINHWRSVFTLIFKQDVLKLVKDLKENFVKVDKGEDIVLSDIAQASKQLLTTMRCYVNNEKPYWKILNDTINNIDIWIESKSPTNIENKEECEGAVPLMQVSSSSQEPQTICSPPSCSFDISLCKEKIKYIFHMIWEQVKNFSFRVTELAATNGIMNQFALNEVKNQFPQVIRTVQELVEITEKILSLGPEDSFQANQIILHFANFLVSLNIFQIDPTELDKLPGYIGLFCNDIDGRLVLSTLVNDLKQFAMRMIEGMKILERL